jgi:hypothetical protein
MTNAPNTPENSLLNRQSKDKQLTLNYIIRAVEKGTDLSYYQLKEQYSEERLFREALQHVTTTKKALCTALNIPVEAGCRYKRELEKSGLLVQSTDEVICPFTKFPAHLISTNPKEFEGLSKTNTNQLQLF